jgi:hypothetical protein
MFMSTKMFNENKNIWRQPSESHALAFGFKVDFSEVRDPIEELGDKPGALAIEFAAMRSDVDDVELPGLWEFKGSTEEECLPNTVKSGFTPSNDLNPGREDGGSNGRELDGSPSKSAA